MLSQSVLVFCLRIPSHTYAALSQFHAASNVAHTSSELGPAIPSTGTVSAITWSPGTMTMTERMTEGAAAEKTKPTVTHDELLENFDRNLDTESLPNMAILRKFLWRRPGRKLKASDQTSEISPSPDVGTDLRAPMVNTMKRYSAEELRYIENKVRDLKIGFDYTYLDDGTFLVNKKTDCDLHGCAGKIRVYDYEDHELLYQTDCCYCKGQDRSWNDLNVGETWLQISFYGCAGVVCGALTFGMKMMCGL